MSMSCQACPRQGKGSFHGNIFSSLRFQSGLRALINEVRFGLPLPHALENRIIKDNTEVEIKMLHKPITIWTDIFVYVGWIGIWHRGNLDMLQHHPPSPKKREEGLDRFLWICSTSLQVRYGNWSFSVWIGNWFMVSYLHVLTSDSCGLFLSCRMHLHSLSAIVVNSSSMTLYLSAKTWEGAVQMDLYSYVLICH